MPSRNPTDAQQKVADFPVGGLDESRAYLKQRTYAGDDGPAYTCADALNVRAYDLASDRRRGGSRPGLSKFCPLRVNAPAVVGNELSPFSIQDINQLFFAPADATQLGAGFVYAKATQGYGLASPAGSSYFTGGNLTHQAFACSCWDDAGNCYVAEVRTENATAALFKADSSGSGTESPTWAPDVGTDVAGVVGMAVVGQYLYVAVAYNATAPLDRVWKFDKDSGAAYGGTHWLSVADDANLVLSAGPNCLNKVGALLGIGSAGAGTQFSIYDTDTKVKVADAGDLGTQNAARACRVDADGTHFYASLPLTSDKKVVKVATDGSVVWTYTTVDNSSSIAYDALTGRLCVLGLVTGAVRLVNSDTGALSLPTSTLTPGGSSIWDNVDSDGCGNFIFWANGVASGDVVVIGPTLATLVGPVTLANATHTGATVYRGGQAAAAAGERSRLLVVAGGNLYRVTRTTRSLITGGRAWHGETPYVLSAQNGAYMYYADGIGYSRYSAAGDLVEAWTASAGTMPLDQYGRAARLIETWRARTVLSGLPSDPQNWFMSAVDNPRDWDYSPAATTETQAVAGNNSPAGKVGQKVCCMIPWSDDVLVFGCTSSIWQMTGDPMAGGRIDQITRSTGMAFGRPWCMDTDGTVYFFASRGGVYAMQPGSKPVEISQQIRSRLQRMNLDEIVVRMAWDERGRGFDLFLTPLDSSAEATHYRWEQRTAAWWPVEYARADMNPKCCHAYDADAADDRAVLVGSWDSYVRAVDDGFSFAEGAARAAGTDDGKPFESFVVLGPFLGSGLGEVMLHELQPIFSLGTGDVTFGVYVGSTAEGALASDPVVTGTLGPGRNFTSGTRRSGYAVYVKLSATSAWSLERLRLRLEDLGPIRRRGA